MTEPVNEADLLDQLVEVDPDEPALDPEDAVTGDTEPGEADPVDVHQQHTVVPPYE